jgi:hypothetical protein
MDIFTKLEITFLKCKENWEKRKEQEIVKKDKEREKLIKEAIMFIS